jgi:hypothetical protein
MAERPDVEVRAAWNARGSAAAAVAGVALASGAFLTALS